jgi:anti-anti-sigma factor
VVEEKGRTDRFAVAERELSEGCTEVRVKGELDLATAPQLEDALGRLIGERRNVLVDLGGCEFIDSIGLATILRARRLLLSHDRTLYVSELSRRVRRTFEVAGLDTPELVRPGPPAPAAQGGPGPS